MSIWDNIHTIVILFESDRAEANTDLQDIILQLRAEGKHVAAWGYAPKHTIYTAPATIFRILGIDDLTLCGKVRKQPLQAWESLSCDLLLDLTQRDLRPLQHLAATSQAKLKAGKLKAGKQDNTPTYQFMIQNTHSRTTLCEQILHYLKTIQVQ